MDIISILWLVFIGIVINLFTFMLKKQYEESSSTNSFISFFSSTVIMVFNVAKYLIVFVVVWQAVNLILT